MLNTIKQVIDTYGMFRKGETVVVGVSGGPDSMVLLYALCVLSKEYGLTLHVAHLDHMLRKTSAADALFVQAQARKLRLGVSLAKAPIAQMSARKGSVEEVARNARLKFFFEVARACHAQKIALAHTLDDQAETVLMRLLRGSGLSGLAGILPVKKMGAYTLVRPLIRVSRSQVERFIKKKRVAFRTDSSNAQNIYFRNKVRNKLLPLLQKEYSPTIKQLLSVTAFTVGGDYDYLQGKAQNASASLGARMSIVKLARMHPALRRMVWRLRIAQLAGDTRRITFAHISEIEDLLFNRPLNSIVDLPRGVHAAKKRGYLIFYTRQS